MKAAAGGGTAHGYSPAAGGSERRPILDRASQQALEQRFAGLMSKAAPKAVPTEVHEASAARRLGTAAPLAMREQAPPRDRRPPEAKAASSAKSAPPRPSEGEDEPASAPNAAAAAAAAQAPQSPRDPKQIVQGRTEADAPVAALAGAAAPDARHPSPATPTERTPAPATEPLADFARLAAALEIALAVGQRGTSAFLVELPGRAASAIAAQVERSAGGELAITLHLPGSDEAHKRRLARDLARHLGERGWRACTIHLALVLQRA